MSSTNEDTLEPQSSPSSRSDRLPDELWNSELLRRAAWSSLYVAGAAGALGGLELWRDRFQRGRVFAPTRYPEGEWDPARRGLPCQDLHFASDDGTRLHGWWLESPGAPRPTLFYCHGNSGSLGTRVEIIELFYHLGFNLFAFDYRGYGKSDGSPSEKGVFQDARCAHDFMTRELKVDPATAVILGHSLGGAVAIDVALDRPASGLVVQSSFTDLRGMVVHHHATSPIRLVARNQFRSLEKVERLKLPKLFIHGTEDETVPFSMGEELYAAAQRPKSFLRIPGAGHNDLHEHGEAYLRMLRRFIRRCCG